MNMDKSFYIFFFLVVVTLVTNGSDPDALQDICVADTGNKLLINGFPCKAQVTSNDFKSDVLKNPGNTSNLLGAVVTAANVQRFPGLNTQGVSFARIDYAPNGTNPPHIHPRGTELLYLQQGRLLVGFITTGDNKLFVQTLDAGELFVFPRGLVHFQLNLANGPALAFVGFNSQNPGTSQVAKAVFASSPTVSDTVLAKAFQLSPDDIQRLRSLIART